MVPIIFLSFWFLQLPLQGLQLGNWAICPDRPAEYLRGIEHLRLCAQRSAGLHRSHEGGADCADRGGLSALRGQLHGALVHHGWAER